MIQNNYAAAPVVQPSNTLLETTLRTQESISGAGDKYVQSTQAAFAKLNEEQQQVEEYLKKYSDGLAQTEGAAVHVKNMDEVKNSLMTRLNNARKSLAGMNVMNPKARAELLDATSKIGTFMAKMKSASEYATAWQEDYSKADPTFNYSQLSVKNEYDDNFSVGNWYIGADGKVMDRTTGKLAVSKTEGELGDITSAVMKMHKPISKGFNVDGMITKIADVKENDYQLSGESTKSSSGQKYDVMRIPKSKAEDIKSSIRGLLLSDDSTFRAFYKRYKGDISEEDFKGLSGDNKKDMAAVIANTVFNTRWNNPVYKPVSVPEPKPEVETASEKATRLSIATMTDGYKALISGDTTRIQAGVKIADGIFFRSLVPVRRDGKLYYRINATEGTEGMKLGPISGGAKTPIVYKGGGDVLIVKTYNKTTDKETKDYLYPADGPTIKNIYVDESIPQDDRQKYLNAIAVMSKSGGAKGIDPKKPLF